MDEMRELVRLRTAAMVKKCSSGNGGIVCPKPRRRDVGRGGVHDESRVGDLYDIISSKASPPYYSVSPPIRTRNPVIHDAHFHKQRVSFGASPVTAYTKHVDNGLIY